jgi:UDP-N-acetyl-D-glucosamine/UDP-N-acetyl-D-galactosamine dehydrogenase
MSIKKFKIGIVGLGYVGLPLAAILSEKYDCVGFDISKERVGELKLGKDRTKELDQQSLFGLKNLSYTCDSFDLRECNFFIVTVPTPVSSAKVPDFEPLRSASKIIGEILKKDDIVVFESTVYPGATEEICIPLLEEMSGLKAIDDFLYGYSPERINPGDSANRVENIKKVTSGCNNVAAEIIDRVYASVILAGTFKAASVRVAEASKVMENAQRDINIAFMNQMSLIFEKLDIKTSDVLDAASTKWNFLRFSPGLVGGHCIGVDPYYLIEKSEAAGCEPAFLKVARSINEGMVKHIVYRIKKFVGKSDRSHSILILGATFKEDCPDLRNSKVKELYELLIEENFDCDVLDPIAIEDEMIIEYGAVADLKDKKYDILILAVPHSTFVSEGRITYERYLCEYGLVFDVKSVLKNWDGPHTLYQL